MSINTKGHSIHSDKFWNKMITLNFGLLKVSTAHDYGDI